MAKFTNAVARGCSLRIWDLCSAGLSDSATAYCTTTACCTRVSTRQIICGTRFGFSCECLRATSSATDARFACQAGTFASRRNRRAELKPMAIFSRRRRWRSLFNHSRLDCLFPETQVGRLARKIGAAHHDLPAIPTDELALDPLEICRATVVTRLGLDFRRRPWLASQNPPRD